MLLLLGPPWADRRLPDTTADAAAGSFLTGLEAEPEKASTTRRFDVDDVVTKTTKAIADSDISRPMIVKTDRQTGTPGSVQQITTGEEE